jgi:hypothetical protein
MEGEVEFAAARGAEVDGRAEFFGRVLVADRFTGTEFFPDEGVLQIPIAGDPRVELGPYLQPLARDCGLGDFAISI